jgi:hypothetical protein
MKESKRRGREGQTVRDEGKEETLRVEGIPVYVPFETLKNLVIDRSDYKAGRDAASSDATSGIQSHMTDLPFQAIPLHTASRTTFT